MRPATSTSPFSSAISWIAGLTVLVFVLARFTGAEAALDYAAGFIPARVHHPDLLDHAGLPFGAVPVILTPLTSALLHGGWIHLGFNMLMLLFCGRQVEQVLGPRLILPLYLVGAYAAAAGQWALGPDLAVPMIGASGAISAMIGAYALLFGSREVKAWGPSTSKCGAYALARRGVDSAAIPDRRLRQALVIWGWGPATRALQLARISAGSSQGC
jgi:membrane associated rhomboid family serine protease